MSKESQNLMNSRMLCTSYWGNMNHNTEKHKVKKVARSGLPDGNRARSLKIMIAFGSSRYLI